jgi:hypothetical protein
MPGDTLQKLFETVDTKLKELARRIKRVEDTARKTYNYQYVLFGGSDAQPTSEAAFVYNETTNTLTVENIAVQTWQTPTLLNSWVNFGSGFNNAGYWKDPFGVVHLRGLVKSGTGIPSTIFTLPAGYRPPAQEILPAVSNALFGECTIETDGDVTAQVGSTVWFSLDGITFRAA